MHHSTRPATGVPEMGKEGGGTSPQGGGRGTPSPQRGEGADKAYLSYFPCIFDFVSHLGLLYLLHPLIIY